MSDETTHVGFSDESNWKAGRYRSLGLVTLPVASLALYEAELLNIIQKSGIREFKWNNCGGARERLGAIKMINFAVQKACLGFFRVDVLLWDTSDSRHAVISRDDTANLQRMYYHLFKNVLNKRWPRDAVWSLFPDEHSEIDWHTLHSCVSFSSVKFEQKQIEGWTLLRNFCQFSLSKIEPTESSKSPFLQLADLFAGMAVFSRDKYQEYLHWKDDICGQMRMFDNSEVQLSGRTQERLCVLGELESACTRNNIGISLKTSRGLYTRNPRTAINFWLYKPQHELDKAPLRTIGEKTSCH